MTSISLLLDLLEWKKLEMVSAPSIAKNYVSDRLFASRVKSFEPRFKVQLCVARGGWRSIQVFVVIRGLKVVVLDQAEVHSSVHPHSPLGFEVPYVHTVDNALRKILLSDPKNWTLAKESSSDPRSGVDVSEL